MLFKILPKKLISSITGILARQALPNWLLMRVLGSFIKKYKVNVDEALYPISHYKTINEFFTRELKKGSRPIDANEDIVVSPVDGIVVEHGKLSNNLFLQVKGIESSLDELIKAPLGKTFINGEFITIYLSPKDYHRIHAPYGANVIGAEHSKGTLYPVNALGLKIAGLFTLNERLCTFFREDSIGTFAMVKVGALNVGSIKSSYGFNFTNKEKKERNIYKDLSGISVSKGQECALFELGSTVILFFMPSKVSFLDNIKSGTSLKMGEAIAKRLKS